MGEGGEKVAANPDKSFVTAVCDFGVVSPPICKSDYVMVLAAIFGCDWTVVNFLFLVFWVACCLVRSK